MDNDSSATTLATIAARLGTSPATVSRALNGVPSRRGGKSAALHRAIRALAEELDFRPSFAGQAIRRGRTMMVALLNPTSRLMLGTAYGRLITGVAEALQGAGYHLLLEFADEVGGLDSASFLGRRVDALVALHELTQAACIAIERSKVPAVAINADGPLPRVLPDDDLAVGQLVDHCIRLGHRRIALVPSRLADNPNAGAWIHHEHFSAAVREAAFRAACSRHGVFADMIPGFLRDDVVRNVLARHEGVRPTALIFLGFELAAASIAAFHLAGLSCPQQISVCSLDVAGDPEASLPALTTSFVPMEECGIRGGKLLLRLIEDRSRGHGNPVERIACPMVVRQSTAPPPARR